MKPFRLQSALFCFLLVFGFFSPVLAQRTDDPPCCFCFPFPTLTYENNLVQSGDTIRIEPQPGAPFRDFTFTVFNYSWGGGALNILSSELTGSGFSILKNLSPEIGMNDTSTLRVRFSSPVPGLHYGHLSFTTFDEEFNLTIQIHGTSQIQSAGIEVIKVNETAPLLDGKGLSFENSVKQPSGLAGTSWVFENNADSLYVAKFANFGGSNAEPHLLFIKCFYPGATYVNSANEYDGFSPNFTAIGGINFVAYIKPGYDEYRYWTGTAWSGANTTLRPLFHSSAQVGTRMEVAIPWSALMKAGGIPDSIKVVCYQTNGNAGGIFSYAQMPETLPSGTSSSPTVGKTYLRKIKEVITLQNPYRFSKTRVGQSQTANLFMYNPGVDTLKVTGLNFDSWLPPLANAFSFLTLPQSSIPSKSYSRFSVEFDPTVAMQSYEATARVTNNSGSTYNFGVGGQGVGVPNIQVTYNSQVMAPASSLSFGTAILQNLSVIRRIVVHSIGQDTLTINPVITLGANRFSIAAVSAMAIPPGDSAFVDLKFLGTTAGIYSGEVRLNPNLPSELFRIILNAQVFAGTGEAALKVKVNNLIRANGDTLSLGPIGVGAISDRRIWAMNRGNDTLRIDTTTLTGSGEYVFLTRLASKIAPGDSSSTDVRFASALPAGFKLAKLDIASNSVDTNHFALNFKGESQVISQLEIRHIACNRINTSGAIPPGQLLPKLLLQDNAGIKWYASWDTTNLYVVKIGGNRTEPELIYIKAHYPGAVFTSVPQVYDNFTPDFSGIGGINFGAYMKETVFPYDEFRTWNGTAWSVPNASLLPNYGNLGPEGDLVAVRIPWDYITKGNGVPDSIRLVLYQTNGDEANIFSYAQCPASLPAGNVPAPDINASNFKKVLTRLSPNSTFDFGNVIVGTPVDTLLLYQNVGTIQSSVLVNGATSVSGAGYEASVQTTGGTEIASGKWAPLRVKFTPSLLGESLGSMTANATPDLPLGSYIVNFKGNGVVAPGPAVGLKLGNALVDYSMPIPLGVAEIGYALDTTIKILNTGQDTLRLSNFNFPLGWGVVIPAFPKIAPGDSSYLKVSKDPVVAGVNSGVFSYSTNIPAQPIFAFTLSLTGDSALSWSPHFPSVNDSITIWTNTNLGNKALNNFTTVYIHTGIITSGPTGTNWENVQGTFNQPGDSVKMTNVTSNRRSIKFKIRDFYNIVGNPTVYRLGMVFRNATGALVGKTRSNGDFYIPINPSQQTAQIQVKSGGVALVNGSTIDFGSVPYQEQRDTLVKIKNTGVVPLDFTLINVSGFSFNQIGTTPLSIPAGDSATVHIQLTSNGIGQLQGFLNLLSNASNSPSLLVNLAANGIVGNAELQRNPDWEILPNPTRDEITVRGQFRSSTVLYRLTDLSGRQIRNGSFQEGSSISLREFPSGAYRLQWTDGEKWMERMVLKQ